MSLCCEVYMLSLIDKGLYLLQEFSSFNYPRTHIEVRNGGIIKLINSLSMVKSVMDNTLDIRNNYFSSANDSIIKIIKIIEKSNNNKDWVSDVTCSLF
ncbi:hypothetical protein HPULCUR_004611 [Helicostylum pulchrum]|uniref:Uncharacterized protein n=1 Tax=Helicostylum pulchrum TaxID=562976 RepID=A0ABP9XWQ9_9FUNG